MLAGILAAVAAVPNQEVRRLERGRSRSHRPKSNPPEVNALLDAKVRSAQEEERVARAEAKRRRKQIARREIIHPASPSEGK